MINIPEIVVVIPAYQPDQKMINILQEIKTKTDYHIIVVNDGSSEDKSVLFSQASEMAVVLKHQVNMGKGQAIKTALHEIKNSYPPETVAVIADADGQHRVDDIIKVCQKTLTVNECLVIGSRNFYGDVPAKSKFGNTVTRWFFKFVSGHKLHDTQTGLRAFRAEMIPFMLSVKGSRYEYEMNVLLECTQQRIPIIEVPIETIYQENNASTHFRAFKDSFIIYKDIIKFGLSSFASFIIDFCVYSFLIWITKGMTINTSILISNVSARIISASANYYINKRFVFDNKDKIVITALKYFCLAAFILLINTFLLTYIVNNVIDNKVIGKIVVELFLFLVSWTIQRFMIFKKNK